MNMTTWLHEQALLVRGALLAGNLNEARNALRFTFEDGDSTNGLVRPAMIIRLALFPMSRENLDAVWNTFRSQADGVFTANDDLDGEIRMYMYTVLKERRTSE